MTMSVVWTAIAVLVGAIGLIAKVFLTSFFRETGRIVVALENVEELARLTEKGKNIATKEDIRDITRGQEEIKHEFLLTMEQHKMELNKLSKEFELYAAKKHEYYPELYKNISWCISNIKGLRGLRRVVDLKKLNKDDIVRLMEDKSFNEADKSLILSYLETDKEVAIKNVEWILRKIEYNDAGNSYIEANNFYLLHRLYFSDEVSLIAEKLLEESRLLWVNYDPDFIHINNPGFQEQLLNDIKGFKENIDELHNELFKQLKGELIMK